VEAPGIEIARPQGHNLPTGHAFRHESPAAQRFRGPRAGDTRPRRSTRIGPGLGDEMETEAEAADGALPPGRVGPSNVRTRPGIGTVFGCDATRPSP
jgi:hypothetical protein